MKDCTKINLGGGRNKQPGYATIDIIAYPEVDIVADVTKGIPLPDNSVEEILALSIIEHLEDTVFIMEEMYRVSKNNAKIIITVPYVKSTAAFKDPTHKKFFTERTFEYFDKSLLSAGRLPDYHMKCDFQVKNIAYKYYTPWFRHIPGINRIFGRFFWDIIKTLTFELRVRK